MILLMESFSVSNSQINTYRQMAFYYYIEDGKRKGPFTLDELKDNIFSPDTLFWREGLESWTRLSELSELGNLNNEKTGTNVVAQAGTDEEATKQTDERQNQKRLLFPKKLFFAIIAFCAVLAFIVFGLFGQTIIENAKSRSVYKAIVKNSYADSSVDFSIYLDKYYRDLAYFKINPTKPKTTIIKFSNLDQMADTKHLHAVSFGRGKDDIVEIYINKYSWDHFNPALRYWVLYHELSHDILNVGDLDATALNVGRLMYPNIAAYEHKTMDDFIEAFHAFIQDYYIREMNVANDSH